MNTYSLVLLLAVLGPDGEAVEVVAASGLSRFECVALIKEVQPIFDGSKRPLTPGKMIILNSRCERE